MTSSATASQTPLAQSQRAIALMVGAMLFLPSIDAIAKYLSGEVNGAQVAWSRFVFQTLFLLPFALRSPLSLFSRDVPLHALRGTLIALAIVLHFSALAYLPLADAISIFFVEPLILTLLSAMLLGERLDWRRLAAVIAGFAGAMLVIRPGFAAFGWPALLPLGAAMSFACYLLLTRTLVQREDPVRMQFYAGVFGMLFMSVALGIGDITGVTFLDPVWPDAWAWCLMALLGAIATSGHLMMVHAFKRAPPGVLAPFQYVEIIGAVALGFALFSDFPDVPTWFGIGIIVASGLYVFRRESRSIE